MAEEESDLPNARGLEPRCTTRGEKPPRATVATGSDLAKARVRLVVCVWQWKRVKRVSRWLCLRGPEIAVEGWHLDRRRQ